MARIPSPFRLRALALVALLSTGCAVRAARPALEDAVGPFFTEHCLRCHGPEKAKGKLTLHTLRADPATGADLDRWERILEMVDRGEMPPDDEPQPAPAQREAVAQWIQEGLRAGLSGAAAAPAPTARRLTNVEYENTMRDLLRFHLRLAERLPPDPVKPYTFNNTAELMSLGPEQIDLYLENARFALAAAIVDPGPPPPVTKARREWKSNGTETSLGDDRVGIWGNRRNTAAHGLSLKNPPRAGEYRIRIQAAAVLSGDAREVPLRLLVGQSTEHNASTIQVVPTDTVALTTPPENPRVFEFRGRMENIPVDAGRSKTGEPLPESITIKPQNLYDDGTLNDNNNFQKTRNPLMPQAAVSWIEFEAPVADPWPPEHHTRILFPSPDRERDPPAYLREVLRRFLGRAFRRPATEAELDHFARIHAVLAPEMPSFEAALRETLAQALISPQFLYHTVAADATGRQFETASRLSYFLGASLPDDDLLAAAGAGKLGTPEEVAAHAERLLLKPASADFARNFTMQWLSLAKMRTVPINRDLFPRFLYYVPLGERAGTEEPYRPTIRDHLLDETIGFFGELIRRNAPVWEIVDTDFSMLNQPLAAHYGVEGVHGHELRPVSLAAHPHLGGLLTHSAVLIGNGTGTAPHPIYRAVWLREAILGDEVAPPPADVPALVDSAGASAEKALSIRDLLAKHRQQESCHDCHARLDPWGIPFEHYNAIGRYQPRVPRMGVRVPPFSAKTHTNLVAYAAHVDTLNTEFVSAETRLPHGPEVNGLDDLKSYLLRERRDEIAENMLRRLLACALGRRLTTRDHATVEELMRESARHGHRLRDMIVLICQSDVFRGVTPAKEPHP